MNKTWLYPYKDGSASAKALAQGLGIKRIKREGSGFKGSHTKTVINWGSTQTPDEIEKCHVLNDNEIVSRATNKLNFFQLMEAEGLSDLIPPWTTRAETVNIWLNDGKRVVARDKLAGHSGEGIRILQGLDEFEEAPLYTLYVPKKHEYRVHCYREDDFLGTGKPMYHAFDIQQKKRKSDAGEVNYQVRNLAGGFIYARNDLAVPACVTDVALKVFDETGLDFGAVDIIYNEKQDRAYALEVNTAPGLTGTTLDNYINMFKELLGD